MRTLSDLPGPKGLPLLGNMLQLDLKQLHRVLEQWAWHFGPLFQFKIGPKQILVITDPEQIQSILKQRPNVYRRLSAIEPVFEEIGITGVFSAEGEDWKRQRRLTAHALDANHLRQFFPTLIKVTERLRKRWQRAADEDYVVDLQRDFMRYTVDVTTNLAFGYDMNTLETEGDVIQEHLEMIFPMINRRINAPFAYWRVFKLPEDRALEKSLAAIRDTINGFVARGRERLAANPDLAAHPTNLLEAMLGARDESGASFSDRDIYGNVLTMLLAGEDTTANTMAWLTHLMTDRAEVQSKMHAEAAEVLGASGLLSALADAEGFKYLEAATNETMRLKPVAPVLFMEPIADAQIGDVTLPAKTPLMLLTMHAPLQDEHFGSAKEFRPERWLQPAPTGCPHNTRAFVPFGSGPRVCPGRHLAMVEIKMAMSMLVANFTVSKADHPNPVSEVFSFTMIPENLFVRFRRRG